eukprot:TRINITY_DN12716_c0_g1_i1.p1 TRINITY_DN12716_c0_g1~~TRINITY_DN12716_c0_g1_i1.p1  ORF type:complete len:373 (+),score=63.62 TRINITY_DN12716_c0_g1_i1:82-1200(+)
MSFEDLDVLPSVEAAVCALHPCIESVLDKLKAGQIDEQDMNDVLTICWERLHHGPWMSVDIGWRIMYEIGAFFKAQLLNAKQQYQEALRVLDLAIILGAGEFEDQLQELAEHVHGCLPLWPMCSNENPPPVVAPKLISLVTCLDVPGLHIFQDFVHRATPVIISGCMNDWPALRKWSDANYLLQTAGWRTVPVETGRSYVDSNVGTALMLLGEYVQSILQGEPCGYLAQHSLFDQIRPLRRDIEVPLFIDNEENVRINAWLGPAATVSPLHTDEPDNLLCQVVGRKYVRLYHPRHTAAMYPHGDSMLSNTSQVDAENADLEKFPEFAQAEYSECILEPGMMLYIPSGHWHYVRALDRSFSVNFWWKKSLCFE